MPGPMVVVSVAERMYCPLDPLGLACTISLTSVARLSRRFDSSKLTLPIGTCTRAVLSSLNSTRPWRVLDGLGDVGRIDDRAGAWVRHQAAGS